MRALVMELVEGPTLADRIGDGPIPLDEALPIARRIAEALEAAHDQDIVHRDLKPANIKVRLDGTVKTPATPKRSTRIQRARRRTTRRPSRARPTFATATARQAQRRG